MATARSFREPLGISHAHRPWRDRAEAGGVTVVRRHEPADHPALTTREMTIWRLLAAGASQQDAAQVMDISYHTVRSYLRGLHRKLGTCSRLDLALLWCDRMPWSLMSPDQRRDFAYRVLSSERSPWRGVGSSAHP